MNQQDQMREALRKSFTLGQRYWQQADSDYESEHKKSDETHQKYRQLVEETLQALAAEPAPLVRLTDDLASSLQTAHFLIEALSQGKEITYSHKSIAMHQIRDSLQRYEDLKKMDAMERVNGGQQ